MHQRKVLVDHLRKKREREREKKGERGKRRGLERNPKRIPISLILSPSPHLFFPFSLLAARGGEPLADLVPVDEVADEHADVLGPPVLVDRVVGVLPDCCVCACVCLEEREKGKREEKKIEERTR